MRISARASLTGDPAVFRHAPDGVFGGLLNIWAFSFDEVSAAGSANNVPTRPGRRHFRRLRRCVLSKEGQDNGDYQHGMALAPDHLSRQSLPHSGQRVAILDAVHHRH
jgi:hypothetical protein